MASPNMAVLVPSNQTVWQVQILSSFLDNPIENRYNAPMTLCTHCENLVISRHLLCDVIDIKTCCSPSPPFFLHKLAKHSDTSNGNTNYADTTQVIKKMFVVRISANLTLNATFYRMSR